MTLKKTQTKLLQPLTKKSSHFHHGLSSLRSIFLSIDINSLSKFSKQTGFQGLVCPCLSGGFLQRPIRDFPQQSSRSGHGRLWCMPFLKINKCSDNKLSRHGKTPRCEELHKADLSVFVFFSNRAIEELILKQKMPPKYNSSTSEPWQRSGWIEGGFVLLPICFG